MQVHLVKVVDQVSKRNVKLCKKKIKQVKKKSNQIKSHSTSKKIIIIIILNASAKKDK